MAGALYHAYLFIQKIKMHGTELFMSKRVEFEGFGTTDLTDNPKPRCACELVLDTSKSTRWKGACDFKREQI